MDAERVHQTDSEVFSLSFQWFPAVPQWKNYVKIWEKIPLPLSKPSVATLTIFSFVAIWNDYMGPMIYFNTTAKKTIQLGIKMFIAQYSAEYELVMAASVLSLIPVLAIFRRGRRGAGLAALFCGNGRHSYESRFHFGSQGRAHLAERRWTEAARAVFQGNNMQAQLLVMKGEAVLTKADCSPEYNLLAQCDCLNVRYGREGQASMYTYIALAVVFIGALNWGLIGLFRLDLIRLIFGDMSLISRIVYVLVGICGLYLLTFFGRVKEQ